MDNSINNVSFKAHLSLQNKSLYKHFSRDVANSFAKETKNIKGTLSVCKRDGSLNFLLKKPEFDKFEPIDYILEIGSTSSNINNFVDANDKQKVVLLKKIARYLDEKIKFDKFEKQNDVTAKQVEAHINRLKKIAGKDVDIIDSTQSFYIDLLRNAYRD